MKFAKVQPRKRLKSTAVAKVLSARLHGLFQHGPDEAGDLRPHLLNRTTLLVVPWSGRGVLFQVGTSVFGVATSFSDLVPLF